MWGLILGVVGLVLYLVFIWWGRKPYVHRGLKSEELPEFFEVLLSRGEIGGQMFVQATEPEESGVLPFIKYGAEGATGVRFALPRVPGGESFFDEVAAKVRSGGFPVREAPPSADEPRPFVYVNFGLDITEATRLVHMVLDDSGGATALSVWFRNVGAGPWRSTRAESE